MGPRLQNEDADALTNINFRHLKAENLIDVALQNLRFGVFDGLLESGEAYFAEVEAAKFAYNKQMAEKPKSSALRRRKRSCTRLIVARLSAAEVVLQPCFWPLSVEGRLHRPRGPLAEAQGRHLSALCSAVFRVGERLGRSPVPMQIGFPTLPPPVQKIVKSDKLANMHLT